MARVLIAGCGYVGTALAASLAVERHEVWTLRRSPTPPPRGVTGIRADLTDVDALRRLPPRLDNVFYTASADGTDDRSYRSAYVDGLRHLLAALDGHPVRRMVFTSSTGVYAQSHGEWVDEDSPTEPTGFSGNRLLEGERLLRARTLPRHGRSVRGHLRTGSCAARRAGAARGSVHPGRPSRLREPHPSRRLRGCSAPRDDAASTPIRCTWRRTRSRPRRPSFCAGSPSAWGSRPRTSIRSRTALATAARRTSVSVARAS